MTTSNTTELVDNGERAQVEHPSSFPSKPSINAFNAALVALLGPRIAKKDVLAFFGHRVAYASIQDWRYGKANPPEWARQRVALAFEPYRVLAENVLRIEDGPGMGWNKGAKTLAAWRARKARGEV